MVVIQNATKPSSTFDGTLDAGPVDRSLNQFIIEPLVIALEMVVLHVFLHRLAKMVLAQRFDLGQTLGFRAAASHNILVSERCNCNGLKAQGNSKLSHPPI